jgi:hypothetical protein
MFQSGISGNMKTNRNEMVLLGKTDFIPAFHPKARRCSKLQLAGLLACSMLNAFPLTWLLQVTIVAWVFNNRKSAIGNRQ